MSKKIFLMLITTMLCNPIGTIQAKTTEGKASVNTQDVHVTAPTIDLQDKVQSPNTTDNDEYKLVARQDESKEMTYTNNNLDEHRPSNYISDKDNKICLVITIVLAVLFAIFMTINTISV